MAKRLLRIFLARLPYLIFSVKGKSMEPSIKKGSTLVVRKTKIVKVHDIIALYSPQDRRIIVKRLLWIKNGEVFVQGDNTEHSTDSRHFGAVASQNIIGKVVRVF